MHAYYKLRQCLISYSITFTITIIVHVPGVLTHAYHKLHHIKVVMFASCIPIVAMCVRKPSRHCGVCQ